MTSLYISVSVPLQQSITTCPSHKVYRYIPSIMACWYDLPFEIKILIAQSYIDIVLSELDEHKSQASTNTNIISTNTAIDQVLLLDTALPFLRRDIIEYCVKKKADGRAQADEELRMLIAFRPKLAYFAFRDLLWHWRSESWQDYHKDLKSGLASMRRYVPWWFRDPNFRTAEKSRYRKEALDGNLDVDTESGAC